MLILTLIKFFFILGKFNKAKFLKCRQDCAPCKFLLFILLKDCQITMQIYSECCCFIVFCAISDNFHYFIPETRIRKHTFIFIKYLIKSAENFNILSKFPSQCIYLKNLHWQFCQLIFYIQQSFIWSHPKIFNSDTYVT